MAKFIVNSTGTKAIRKEDVTYMEIERELTGSDELGMPTYGGWILKMYLGEASRPQITFEREETSQAVQLLAAPILTALES